VLLLNDFYFKATFHNTFTGKLSDFVGLLIFPWFWSLFFPRRSKPIYFTTPLLFIFWKLDVSTPFINFCNEHFGSGFSRVLDKSDFIALTVLPFSFFLLEKSKENISQLKLGLKVGVSTLSIFAFLATSSPDVFVSPSWEFDNTYILQVSKEELLTKRMKFMKSQASMDSIYLDNSLFLVNHFSQLGYNLNFIVGIDSISNQTTLVSLKKLQDYGYNGYGSKKKDELSKEGFLDIFEKEFIEVLESPGASSNPFVFWIFEGD
jgi:hypothetical protein